MNIKSLLIHLLSRKKYKGNFNPASFRKILIIRPAKIGDTICMFPLIRELKKAIPSANIDIYAGIHNNFMFKNVTQVNSIYTKYRKRNKIKTLIDLLKMRHNKYDLIIDTMELRLGNIIKLLFINAKWMIANNENNRYQINPDDLYLYYLTNPYKKKHVSDKLTELLDLLDIRGYDNTMELKLDQHSINYAQAFLKPYHGFNFIGLNADTSDLDRSLTDSDIIDMCQQLTKKTYNTRILLFCSRKRQEYMKSLIRTSQLEHVILEQGSKNIFDAAALVNFMKVIVSPDTCFIHIASALNIPTVGIYQNNPEHIKAWAPKSQANIIIQPEKRGNNIRGFSINETVTATIQLLDAYSD